MLKNKNRKGQEEMVGFALIIIIVSVIILVFLGFFLSNRDSKTVESYETESFVVSSLQYSTECRDFYGYLSVNELMFMCDSEINCRGGEDSCEVLDSVLNEILESSWKVGGGSPIQGYQMNITSNTGEGKIFSASSGNITRNSEGTLQPFSKGGVLIEVLFNVYY